MFSSATLSDNNLSEVNKIILEIVTNFNNVGIKITDSMFNISENVALYMKALLNNSDNIQDIFNSVYWKTSDILSQIELSFRYIYNQNKNAIDEYYKKKYANFDFKKFLSSHRDIVNQADMSKHTSMKYLYDLFMNGTYVVDDFTSESNVQNLFSKVLADSSSDRNYECLIKLKKTLLEYRGFKEFEYIVKDFKELYSHKGEFKDLYPNKLKEIEKKESLIVALNKKINKKGLFKLNKKKLESTQNERNKVITELINDYNELDTLKIKDDIYNFVNEDTDLYNVLVFTSYNFEYFVHLLELDNEEMTIVNIDKHMLKLKKFIYDNYIDVLNNILISEDKSLEKIIVDMYKLNSIVLSEDDLALDQINKYLENVDKLLVYFDVYTVMLNLKDVDFLLKAPAIINK